MRLAIPQSEQHPRNTASAPLTAAPIGFVDHRPGAVNQRQDAELAAQGPRADAHRAMAAMMAASPRMTAQRVQATTQAKGVAINSDPALEREADQMGARAAAHDHATAPTTTVTATPAATVQRVVQLVPDPTVATINPKTTRSVVLNLFDTPNVVYLYGGTAPFFYKPLTNEYFDTDDARTPLLPAPGFNENAVPAAAAAGGQNTFRGLNFTVDASNRVTRAIGRIHQSGQAPETGRSGGAQTGAWEHVQSLQRSMFYTAKSFNGGHIIAHHLGGSPGTDNMVPMEKDYNQSGAYKVFENAIDGQFDALNTSLDIDITVTYATDFNDLMTHLVTADAGNTKGAIHADANAEALVMRTLGRIPKTITLAQLDTLGGASKLVASPGSPMTPLRAALRSPYNIQNIFKTKFNQTRTTKEGKSKTTREPFSKSFGPNKNQDIDVNKDYHAHYQALYANMPRPGITEYIGGANGLAGGVKAFIWIDPMGVYDRFGGSETNDVVDPQGSAWAYFRKAVNHGGGGKIYKKGHLLNAHLHGPGADSRNLLPITTAANNAMSANFEQLVKGLPALVDPAKGVLWETRTGGNIARPVGWNRLAAAAHQSALLFDEEAKLPQYIDCFAWEAIQHHGNIEKGRLLLQYRAQNKHPGDTDGELGITYAGAVANDTGVQGSVPIGNNNVTGHAAVAPVGGDNARYAEGYAKHYQWLADNLGVAGVERHYLTGLADVAYDEGFALQAPDAKAGWSAREVVVYDEHYQKGRDKLSYKSGYLGADHPVHGDARADSHYGDGLYQRGRDAGEHLEVPAPNIDGPLLRGYKDGWYFRGRKDAEIDQLPAIDNEYYNEGYLKSLRVKAYDQGYECEQPHHIGFDDPQYWGEYCEGQRHRGQRHGYGLKGTFGGQSDAYYQGYDQGAYDRGREDGWDLFGPQGNAHSYINGHYAGLMRRGMDDGARLLPRQSGAPPYVAGWRRGMRQRGKDDGYDNRRPAHGNLAYRQGWRDGASKVTYDEAYRAVPARRTTHDLGRYHWLQVAYDNGRYDSGRDDGRRGWPAAFNDQQYQAGHALGRQDRVNRRRGWGRAFRYR